MYGTETYGRMDLTPTRGREIIELNILPLGELTEGEQEVRKSDCKHIQIFNNRKCSLVF